MTEAAEARQRLAAILAADAAGYSRLMALDELATIASLDAARHVFQASIARHKGRVVDMAGDSVLAVFDTATSAVNAALEVQQALEAGTQGVPADRRMRFRIGVHMGDINEKADGSVYGDGVNIAARLEGLALPGGITVSDAVRGSVRNRVTGLFEDLGEQAVKNIADPVRVFRVVPKQLRANAGAASFEEAALASSRLRWWRWKSWWWGALVGLTLIGAAAYLAVPARRTTTLGGPPLLSVAVLPFKSSGATGTVPLADEFTQELTTRLAQTVAGHSVLSSAAVQAYGGDLGNVAAVGKELVVRYVVQGDIRRDGDQVVVAAQLINTLTRAQAWAAQFVVPSDRSTGTSHLAVLRVLNQLRPALYEAEAKRLPKVPASDASAFELAFRGIFVQTSLVLKEQIKISTDECDAALRLEPTLALALWCKARVAEWLLYGSETGAAGVLDVKRLAEMDDLTSQAVAMDRFDADILNARADALRYRRKWEAVSEARARAMQLNPALTETYIGAASDNIRMGQAADALAALSKARDVDPNVVKEYAYLTTKCRAQLALGQYDEAIASCEKAETEGFGSVGMHVYLAAAYAQSGQVDKAAVARDRAISEQRGLTIASWKALSSGLSDRPAYFEQIERYIVPGLRKAGFPEN